MAIPVNIFAELPSTALADEPIVELLTAPNCRIERIFSTGQASPPDYWYDQDWNEWVILLRGSARLLSEDEAEARALGPGDYVHKYRIPPGRLLHPRGPGMVLPRWGLLVSVPSATLIFVLGVSGT